MVIPAVNFKNNPSTYQYPPDHYHSCDDEPADRCADYSIVPHYRPAVVVAAAGDCHSPCDLVAERRVAVVGDLFAVADDVVTNRPVGHCDAVAAAVDGDVGCDVAAIVVAAVAVDA